MNPQHPNGVFTISARYNVQLKYQDTFPNTCLNPRPKIRTMHAWHCLEQPNRGNIWPEREELRMLERDASLPRFIISCKFAFAPSSSCLSVVNLFCHRQEF